MVSEREVEIETLFTLRPKGGLQMRRSQRRASAAAGLRPVLSLKFVSPDDEIRLR